MLQHFQMVLQSIRAIQKNQDLEPKTPLINIFYDDFWGTPLTHSGSHKSYRPLCVLSFRLNYYLGELNPWGYHLGNVILHTLVTALFTHFSRVFLKQTFSTLVSGLVFASHPVHTEAVAGIVGRADIGACLFFILAVMSYMKYVHLRDVSHDPGGETSRSLRYLCFGGTAILTTASMLSKEQGVTVLGVCAAFDLFVHNKMTISQILQFYKQPKTRQTMEGVFLLGLLGVCLVSFRIYFMGNNPPEFASSDNPASDSDSFVTRTLTYLLLPPLNLWLLLCPRILSFDWSMTAIPLVESVTDYRNLFTVVFYSGLVYIVHFTLSFIHNHSNNNDMPFMNGNGHSSHVIHSHSRHSSNKNKSFSPQKQENLSQFSDKFSKSSSSHSINVLIVAMALLVFPFIPASNLFFYVGFVLAERILYIPSMGFCLLVGHGSYKLYKRLESKASNKQKVIIMAIGSLIMLNGSRTVVRNMDWFSEENLFTSGLTVNPAKAWGNLANIYNNQGKITEAENAYRNALKYRPNMSDVHYNLGILLQNQKRYKESLESYKKAISFRPNLSMAYLNLGILLAELGDNIEAEKVYQQCAELDTMKLKDPRLHEQTKISCLYNLGRLYNDAKRFEESIVVFKEALKRRPDYYAPHSLYNMYGEVYVNTGRFAEAEHWFREALAAKPDHIPAHLTMAKLKQKMGQLKESESWFLKAKEVDPNERSIYQHYAQFLGDIGRLQESADMFRSIIEKEPENFEVHFNAANILRQLQQNVEAEKLFRKAAELRPNEGTAHMNLGAMYHINGKHKEAEKAYLRALELKPNDKTTEDNLKKLRNLK